jgi:hypothetical protein
MTDTDGGQERKHRVERYRVLAQEITDPLAAGLLRDIISELEAELKELAEMDVCPTATCGKPGVLEFHGRTVLCRVRDLSKSGAVLDVVSPSRIPERLVLELPWFGTFRRCRLVWRSETGIGVTFQ